MGDEQDHEWEITLAFQDGTKQSLEHSGNSLAGSETYTQLVEGRLVRGLGPTIESNRFFKYVICTNSWNRILP